MSATQINTAFDGRVSTRLATRKAWEIDDALSCHSWRNSLSCRRYLEIFPTLRIHALYVVCEHRVILLPRNNKFGICHFHESKVALTDHMVCYLLYLLYASYLLLVIATFSRKHHAYSKHIIPPIPIRVRKSLRQYPNPKVKVQSLKSLTKDLNTCICEKKNSRTVSGNFGRGKVDHKTYKDQVTGGSNGRAARALLLRPIISFSLPLPPFSFFLCLAIR